MVLANRNSPAQGVLSGSRESIKMAEEACRFEGSVPTARSPQPSTASSCWVVTTLPMWWRGAHWRELPRLSNSSAEAIRRRFSVRDASLRAARGTGAVGRGILAMHQQAPRQPLRLARTLSVEWSGGLLTMNSPLYCPGWFEGSKGRPSRARRASCRVGR